MKCMEKQERTKYWNFQKGNHRSFSSDSVNAVLLQWLKKTMFYQSGWGRGFAVVGFRVRRSCIWVMSVYVCVYICTYIYIYIYIYRERERQRQRQRDRERQRETETQREREGLSLWRIIMYLFPKLHICYVIRVAISEARNGYGTVFTILGCSSSGMKLVLGDGKVHRRGMDELWNSEQQHQQFRIIIEAITTHIWLQISRSNLLRKAYSDSHSHKSTVHDQLFDFNACLCSYI